MTCNLQNDGERYAADGIEHGLFPIYFGEQYYIGDAELRDRCKTRSCDESDEKRVSDEITKMSLQYCGGDCIPNTVKTEQSSTAVVVQTGTSQILGPLNIMAAIIPIETGWSTCPEWCTACNHKYWYGSNDEGYDKYSSTNSGSECVCSSSFEIVYDENSYDDESMRSDSGSSRSYSSSSCSEPFSQPSVESLRGTIWKKVSIRGRGKRTIKNPKGPKDHKRFKRNNKK